ncbi:MAG: hypothetical protein IPM79_24575 [Polyangiaceae bacterium]|nr:hypothetical protein [Polyangiaceae bacterium]
MGRAARHAALWGACTLLAASREAYAVGWLGGPGSSPTEERIAIASSLERTTLVVQVRFTSAGGPVAVLIPVDEGAMAAWSSRAFFEGLEDATAPRVVAPDSIDGMCGDEPASFVFSDAEPLAPLDATEIAIVQSPADVAPWAAERGLLLTPALTSALGEAAPAQRFLIARFEAPEGDSLTRALRVVAPGASSSLPLELTAAGTTPLRIVTWTFGAGRAIPAGSELFLDASRLTLGAAEKTSNYPSLLEAAFGAELSDPYLIDMSSHPSLAEAVALGDPGPVAPAFSSSYFSRAAEYGEAIETPSTCIQSAAAILGQSAPVGTACPRSEVAIVGAAACTSDAFQPGQVDPALLRCGAALDDLAVILSDVEPDEVWLTRSTIMLAPAAVATQRTLTFAAGPRLDPVLEAGAVDLSGCPDGSGGAGGAGAGGGAVNGPTSSGTGGTVVEVPIYSSDGCTCDGAPAVVGYVEETESEAPDAYYVDECSGDTSGSYEGDDCSSTTESGSDSAFDDCSCEDTGSYDTSEDACSGGDSSSDSCGGDTGGEGSEGCDFECAVRTKPAAGKRPRRRLNVIVYAALFVIVPVRRWTRRRACRPTNERPASRSR